MEPLDEAQGERNLVCPVGAVRILDSITARSIPAQLAARELFPDLSESVIPECIYRESRRERNGTPD
jgi:hypothetical protein